MISVGLRTTLFQYEGWSPGPHTMENSWRIHGYMEHWLPANMPTAPPTTTTGEVPAGLQTAEEIAKFLNMDPHTVLNWAKTGIIPEAFRVGRTVRFDLGQVLNSLKVNTTGEGRSVELVVLALSLTFGPAFPRIPKVDLGSITVDEMVEIKRLCAAYAADMEDFVIPEQFAAYAEAVLEAARLVTKGAGGELDAETRATPEDCSALADSLLGAARLELMGGEDEDKVA